ncbi:BLOC-3 complex member HPS1-like isoform X2 [Halichondria panicea]|uniref:BLOC-3 complex member HPS1-like isoform X2 n=1 Tax=Halichondria panicea TaxID=6063 RepID=UPI00312B64A1
MKGILIFDDKSDLAFFCLDKEMKRYVIDRIRTLDIEAGSNADDIPTRDLRDCLSAFCLPFFTSFDVLQSLRKPIFSISVGDGFLLVFRKFDEHVYIALSKEGDSEEVLTKKLLVFNRIVTLLYGPVHNKLSSPDVNMRKSVWARLSSVYRTYEALYLTDQIFLIEALEHVQFGQLVTASSVVQRLAREIMDSNCNGGLSGIRHVMLLVNTKLLTTYGRSPRLETSDILMLTLLVYHHFHNHDDEEEEETEEESSVDRETPEEDETSTPPEENETNTPPVAEGGEEVTVSFQTPCSTPGLTARSSDPDYESIDEMEGAEPAAVDSVGGPLEAPPLPRRQPQMAESLKRSKVVGRSLNSPGPKGVSRIKNALSSLLKRGGQADYTLPTGTQPENAFFEMTVFLQPQKDQLIPHTLYCYQVYQNIVLLMIGDQGAGPCAGNICQILVLLGHVFGSNRAMAATTTLTTADLLEDSVKRLKEQISKEASSITDREVLDKLTKTTRQVLNAWANLKKHNFRGYMEKKPSDRNKGPDAQRNFTRMDACATDLREKLMKVFDILYLVPKKKEYNEVLVMSKLVRHFANFNKDYSDFLSLKGEVNIPMVSFSMQFPGMVHFIYVDRSFDDSTTPSLTMDGHAGNPYVEKAAKKTGESGSVFLRRKIWGMVQRVQRFLGHSYTIQTWLDEDFLYVYFLWINIPNNPLGTPIRFYSLSNVKAGDYSIPGVIGTPFYADVHNLKEGYMYELYAMFENKVSIKEASDHCRGLADQLWPNSRESVAPFSLIN